MKMIYQTFNSLQLSKQLRFPAVTQLKHCIHVILRFLPQDSYLISECLELLWGGVSHL